MYVDDIRLADISTRSEYILDIWVLRNNKKMLISRVLFWNQILPVARRINKQDDYTNYMISVIAIVMWLFSSVHLSGTRSNPELEKELYLVTNPGVRFSHDVAQIIFLKNIGVW